MTPEEAAKQYGQLVEVFAKSIRGAEIAALSGLRARMSRRIHNEGKNSEGGSIGRYKAGPYKKRREKKGLQTSKVDLTFNRDLFRSYRVGIVTGTRSTALGFVNDRQRIKGAHNEERYGPVFHPTRGETLQQTKDYATALSRKVRDALNTL